MDVEVDKGEIATKLLIGKRAAMECFTFCMKNVLP